MGITDQIEAYLLELLRASAEGTIETHRHQLSAKFQCAPSQITYVLNTRFSPERGFIVESQRGWNGYIRITRARLNPEQLIMQTISRLGTQISLLLAQKILEDLVEAGSLDAHTGRCIRTAVGDKALSAIPPNLREQVRADLMKQLLILEAPVSEMDFQETPVREARTHETHTREIFLHGTQAAENPQM